MPLIYAGLILWTAVPARSAADYSKIDAPYFRREQPGNLERSLAAAEAAIKDRPDDPGLLWRKGRALVRRGERQARRAEKLADYLSAEDALRRAVELDAKEAEAHYWYGVAMGRRGETQGVLKSLFLVKPIRREMGATLALDPGHGGAHRVLGEILWQVPGFAGGDKKKALAEFEAAVRLAPSYTANYEILAEAYLKYGRKDDAVRTLRAVAGIKTPADPAAYPEDLAGAEKLLKDLSL